jgi:serine/threonine protein phosphatase PrpC
MLQVDVDAEADIVAENSPLSIMRKAQLNRSVLYKRQGDSEREPSKPLKPPSSTGFCGCFEGLFGTMLGYTAPKNHLAYAVDIQEYRQHLEDLPTVSSIKKWEELSDTEKAPYGGIEIVFGTQCKEGTDGWINQDSYVACLLPSHNNQPAPLLVGVFDGHGRYGHEASQIIASRLPGYLAMSDPLKDPKKALETAFAKVDADVYKGLGPDVAFSGSTGVVALIDVGKRVAHLANVGDSRAIMGQHYNGQYHAKQLTVDLKPHLDEEQARIELSGGVVSQIKEDGVCVGPSRVWEDGSCTKPGLACSRSFGDGCARGLGVIATPVISKYNYTHNDKMMIIATDGVWDSLENIKAVSTVGMFLTKGVWMGVKGLIGAVRRVEGGECTDDTTIVVVKFG